MLPNSLDGIKWTCSTFISNNRGQYRVIFRKQHTVNIHGRYIHKKHLALDIIFSPGASLWKCRKLMKKSHLKGGWTSAAPHWVCVLGCRTRRRVQTDVSNGADIWCLIWFAGRGAAPVSYLSSQGAEELHSTSLYRWMSRRTEPARSQVSEKVTGFCTKLISCGDFAATSVLWGRYWVCARKRDFALLQLVASCLPACLMGRMW